MNRNKTYLKEVGRTHTHTQTHANSVMKGSESESQKHANMHRQLNEKVVYKLKRFVYTAHFAIQACVPRRMSTLAIPCLS